MTPIKRALLLALTIFPLILAGCASFSGDKAAFEAWRAEFLAAESREITAVVRCSEGEKVCEYELKYTKNSEGEFVEVLNDELIAGVTAHIFEGEEELIFDGAVLETGSTISGGLSPVSALPHLMKSLSEGYVKTTGREKKDGEELKTTELEMPDGERTTLWQKTDSMEPVFAAVRSDESVDITILFTKIQ